MLTSALPGVVLKVIERSLEEARLGSWCVARLAVAIARTGDCTP
jgi:hypothetical protein